MHASSMHTGHNNRGIQAYAPRTAPHKQPRAAGRQLSLSKYSWYVWYISVMYLPYRSRSSMKLLLGLLIDLYVELDSVLAPVHNAYMDRKSGACIQP